MTWGEIRQALKKEPEFANTDLGLLTVWIQEEYDLLLNARVWAESVGTSQFATVAPYNAGSITVAAGSQVITGTGTTWAAAMVGRLLVIGGAITGYIVMAVNSATQLVVDSVPIEAPGTWAYSILQPYYELAPNCDVPTMLQLPWREPSGPCRPDLSYGAVASTPVTWRQISDTPQGGRRVELLPPPDAEYSIPYTYSVTVSRFNGINTQDSPAPWVLPGAIIDGVRGRTNPAAREHQQAVLQSMSVRDILRRGPVLAQVPRQTTMRSHTDEDW